MKFAIAALIIIIVSVLYCSLIVAGRADEEMERYEKEDYGDTGHIK